MDLGTVPATPDLTRSEWRDPQAAWDRQHNCTQVGVSAPLDGGWTPLGSHLRRHQFVQATIYPFHFVSSRIVGTKCVFFLGPSC